MNSQGVRMDSRWLATMVIAGAVAICGPGSAAQRAAGASSDHASASSFADPTVIPPLPRGKTTIFGGEMKRVDPVRDQMTLDVYGQRPLQILFDERTQVYRDGKKVPLHDLVALNHVSVETTLDGSKLFAVSVHALSAVPEGEYEGRVVDFRPSTGELTVSSGLSSEEFRVLVQSTTTILRMGQSTFSSRDAGASDLRRGSLVSVEFGAATGREAVAKRVEVLAVPGSSFVFSGTLSWIDLHAGLLVLVDPQDQKEHQIFLNPSSGAETQAIHLGDRVRIEASYDGVRYQASNISVIKP